MVTQDYYHYATGKRKSAIARVRLVPGDGVVIINGKPMEQLFNRLTHQAIIMHPLRITSSQERFNVLAKVEGGGISGQAGAISHGIARALLKVDESFRALLRKAGLLTRDPRVKERKKYGLKRARKAPQYTKR